MIARRGLACYWEASAFLFVAHAAAILDMFVLQPHADPCSGLSGRLVFDACPATFPCSERSRLEIKIAIWRCEP